jgi:RNA polymerase sigma-70 factor (ECF subfamily)
MRDARTADDLDELAGQFYQPLLRYAFSLCGNTADASDLAQQTFYIAQIRRHQVRDPRKIRPWLFTTLTREFLQRRRRQTRFPQVELEHVERELPLLTRDDAMRLDGTLVLRALKSLDKRFQAPLCLFYLEDMSYREIAAELAVPIGTVMSRLARGKEQLRRLLKLPQSARAAASAALSASEAGNAAGAGASHLRTDDRADSHRNYGLVRDGRL